MVVLGLSKVFWNFLVFAIIQTVFFHTIVSEFAFKIIDDKVTRLGTIISKYMPDSQLAQLEKKLQQSLDSSREATEMEKKKRSVSNYDFLLKTVGPLILGGALAFGITFWSAWDSPTQITPIDYAVFGVILGSYLTEVGIFFILMNRFEYIGTTEIIKKINDKLPPRIPDFRQVAPPV